MTLNAIGSNIRKYRKLLRLKQEDLAERSGLSAKYIGQIERGEKQPSLDTFIAIVNALDISSDMLLCDVITCGYRGKVNRISERIEMLPPRKQNLVCDMLELLIQEELSK